MAGAEVGVGDLMVVRFSPASVVGLTEDAEDSAAECRSRSEPAVYSVSAFGLVKCSNDADDDLVRKICEDAPVGGRTIFTTTDIALEAEGFQVLLSEPPLHHYDVVLGDQLRTTDVERLNALFELGRRRNPVWKKSS